MAALVRSLSVLVLSILCGVLPVHSLASLQRPVNCTVLGNTVDCVGMNLQEFPKDLQNWTTKLSLASNKITSIPDDAFSDLPDLEEINLSNNEISELDGSVFSTLLKLKKIKLAYNKLTSFPEFPSPLPLLTDLILIHNDVTSLPRDALAQLPKLRDLELSYNKITSLNNDTFHLHPHLHNLYLNNNRVSSLAPRAFANLTKLTHLKLSKNKLTTIPKGTFSQLQELVILELSKNELTTIDGLMFKGLGKLQTLELKRNDITELMDGAFYGLTAITNLYLDHNNISVVQKGWMYGLDSLQVLSLSHNRLEKIEEEAWDECGRINQLELNHNALRSITVSSFSGLQSLKNLYLDHNRISYIANGAFAQLHSLDRLFMNYNNISWTLEDVSGAFDGLGSLTRLGLSHNQIKSIAGWTFQALESLKQLYLDGNEITALSDQAFEPMANSLNVLRLNSSSFLCDCQLGWFPGWVRLKGFQETVAAKCAHPDEMHGTSVMDITQEQFQCVNFPKPLLLTQPESHFALKGSNINLTCEAVSSDDSMTVVWKRNNSLLSSSIVRTVESYMYKEEGSEVQLTTTLHIEGVSDMDRGMYQCVISNNLGTAYSNKANITVHVFPTFIRTPSDITVKAGAEAVLACAATGEPKPEIVWQKVGADDFPAARERRMGVSPPDMYSIEDVKSQDQGVYSCMATNAAGTIVANATLQVLEVPHFIEEMQDEEVQKGETAVIKCRTSGNPRPKIKWLKEGELLQISERHFFTAEDQLLIIVETSSVDAGEYTCVTTNTLGEDRGMSYLVVKGAGGGGAGSLGGSGVFSPDDSTMTGIIIIAVVCCVVGTSLVWVIIIYQTRKKRDNCGGGGGGAGGSGGQEEDAAADFHGSPHPLVAGPPYKSYNGGITGGYSSSGLYAGGGSESQTMPLTGEEAMHRHHHHDSLSGWGSRRHSDSAGSSHSTQSTRSTGLLSTFHPTATLPRASTLLSYSPQDCNPPTTYPHTPYPQHADDAQSCYAQQPHPRQQHPQQQHPQQQHPQQQDPQEGLCCKDHLQQQQNSSPPPPAPYSSPLQPPLAGPVQQGGPTVAVVHALPLEGGGEQATGALVYSNSSCTFPSPTIPHTTAAITSADSSISYRPQSIISSSSSCSHPAIPSSPQPLSDTIPSGAQAQDTTLCSSPKYTNSPDPHSICDTTPTTASPPIPQLQTMDMVDDKGENQLGNSNSSSCSNVCDITSPAKTNSTLDNNSQYSGSQPPQVTSLHPVGASVSAGQKWLPPTNHVPNGHLANGTVAAAHVIPNGHVLRQSTEGCVR